VQDLIATLAAPLQFELTRRALLEVTIVGVASGAVGVLVVLRGLSFIGDALGHTVVPGVVVGYLTHSSLELWGGAAALLSAWGIALLVRRRWLGGDASIAVVFTSVFAMGLALISATGSYLGDLTEILFGNILGVDATDLALGAGAAALVLVVLVLLYRPLILACFDPVAAQVLGLSPGGLDFALYAMIALCVIAGAIAAGSVLVTALLIVPAAAARLHARRVWSQMVLSASLATLAGWSGLYTSYYLGWASGGSVVLAAVLLFGVALGASPRVGLPSLWLRRASAHR
jgi:manganese/iron transport system permease protein